MTDTRFSVEGKSGCIKCSRRIDVVSWRADRETRMALSRHLKPLGRGFCPGSLAPMEQRGGRT